jgi:hypothetical protein
MMDDLIAGTIGKKRVRSHSVTLPSPKIGGKDKQTTERFRPGGPLKDLGISRRPIR